jgi:hypothetical protein
MVCGCASNDPAFNPTLCAQISTNPANAAQTETFVAGQNPTRSLGGGFYAGKRATVSEGEHIRGVHDNVLAH